MKIKRRLKSPWRKKARRGFRGYPVATVAYYGPTDKLATKVAVGIVLDEGAEPAFLERWLSEGLEIRKEPEIESAITKFITSHDVRSVVIPDGILGCPHEEGVDYAEGKSCPKCPFWVGRDRFTGERIH